MTDWLVNHLWLIPAVPLVASLIILGIPKTQRRAAAGLAIISQVAGLVGSIGVLAATLSSPEIRFVQNFTWFTFGEQALRIGWMIDPLAAAMLVMITAVGLCIFVFSTGYMAADKNYTRFFAYLSFFSAAMLGLVLSN